jgi:hypothetical protein
LYFCFVQNERLHELVGPDATLALSLQTRCAVWRLMAMGGQGIRREQLSSAEHVEQALLAGLSLARAFSTKNKNTACYSGRVQIMC